MTVAQPQHSTTTTTATKAGVTVPTSRLPCKGLSGTTESIKSTSLSARQCPVGVANRPSLGKLASKDAAEAWSPPPFTLKQVRDAIPAHCFERDTLRSFSYIVHDLVLVVALFYAATYIHMLPLWYQIAAWPAYWFAQGVVCTGLWVIAHECGHGAFSPSTTINNITGFILHSALLVPYFSWKYTHSKHHKATGHMTKDQVFVPAVRSEIEASMSTTDLKRIHQLHHSGEEDEHPLSEMAPIVLLFEIARMLLFGWPTYLLANMSGQNHTGWPSHFNPVAQIFDPKHYIGVIMSCGGVLATIAGLTVLGQIYGSLNMLFYYVIPYLFVNFWLVTITFLQHTDPVVPHYRHAEWDFLRGALSTVDRDYGLLNYFHHHIGDTHVAHHLFSTMPHYHAQEATEALKKVIGKYYLYDNTPIFEAMYRSQMTCRFVEDTGDVLWFKY
ncbi:hypothetical protein BASA50_009368 [Batrachochytrium salamandrivorans]|uniref:Fatty acid desaturase domain-containing protein n=1 Tax=Batrachochytrium salamandrivorans TaxID=1357716 RepID=A0ABQ8F1G3_9FUNG|nr:hypothetical protein BASA61_007371 [Batrachochytrium salamandrivorans]KAH6590393.1 hypothetical protein BASA50_009368 [Batrachochytrium salamandrivorans]